MICPTCHKETDSVRSIIRNGSILDGCDSCINLEPIHGASQAAKYNRQMDYRDHAQDLVQPFEQRNYLKARGIEGARKVGATDEEIRLLY